MILVTGAAGFIGSCLVSYLQEQTTEKIIIVDDFSNENKLNNWKNLNYFKKLNRVDLFSFLENHHDLGITTIYHIGARTDTTENNWGILEKLNLSYSKYLWNYSSKYQINFIYASSAATYGNGQFGFEDSHDIISKLTPLNLYGKSKNDFDIWALNQDKSPKNWYGFKFFNVYGPNEYHKGRMASVIFHAFNQINKTGQMNLFKSHREDYLNGEQKRDFIFVEDVIKILFYFNNKSPKSGLYNLGTGQSRTFNDLVKSVFKAINIKENINYIDTPIDIREKYQYFTEANMDKVNLVLNNDIKFKSLEEGVSKYVKEFLLQNNYY